MHYPKIKFEVIFMYSELLKVFKTEKYCSFYTGDDYDKFFFGKIIALNNDEVAIHMYSTGGGNNGVLVKHLPDIYRIECDSKYNKKMEKLIESDNTECNIVIDSDSIFESAVKFAIDNTFVISIVLFDCDHVNVTGMPLSLENGICTIKQIDDYGQEDGITSFLFDNVTQIEINTEYEQIIKKLMDRL
jgi:hypothetical protein